MVEVNLEYKMFEDIGPLNFGGLAVGISSEPNLLPVTAQGLKDSFEQGLAMAMITENDPVGYVRFEPLLTDGLRKKLSLPEQIPLIWEMGTVYLAPEYRGRDLYRGFNNAFLTRFSGLLARDELLVIGTTKTARYLSVLDHAREMGINFHTGNHLEFSMVAAFTCIYHGSFGQGMQISENCPSRIPQQKLEVVREVARQRLAETIHCMMFVSSQQLATKTNSSLVEHFNPGGINPSSEAIARKGLVRALLRERYYPGSE